MIKVVSAAGLPLYIDPDEVSAFGSMQQSGMPDIKSYVLFRSNPESWYLRTELADLERMILETTEPKGKQYDHS